EVQTIFVLLGVLLALMFTGHETWRQMVISFTGTLGHLREFPLTFDAMQGYSINAALVVAKCVWPVVVAAMLGGLLAGGMQSRFQTGSDALELKWERLNPVEGLKRLFSIRSAVPTLVALAKLAAIILLTYSQVRTVLEDPIFATPVSAARIANF